MANEYSVIYLDDERNAGRPVLVDNRLIDWAFGVAAASA